MFVRREPKLAKRTDTKCRDVSDIFASGKSSLRSCNPAASRISGIQHGCWIYDAGKFRRSRVFFKLGLLSTSLKISLRFDLSINFQEHSSAMTQESNCKDSRSIFQKFLFLFAGSNGSAGLRFTWTTQTTMMFALTTILFLLFTSITSTTRVNRSGPTASSR